MLLHGSFICNDKDTVKFLFWGEDGNTLYKRRGRATANPLPIYPGLTKCEELKQVTEQEDIEFKAGAEEYSAGIYKMESAQGGVFEAVPYEIRGISYSPVNTLSLLLKTMDRSLQDADIRISPEIIFWAQCVKFLAELIIKHRFYPVIKSEGSALYSYWSILVDRNEDRDRMNILCQGMPPACRTVFSLRSGNEDYRLPSPRYILTEFMNYMADYIIRDLPLEDYGYRLGTMLSSDEEIAWMKSLNNESGAINVKLAGHQNVILGGYSRWAAPLEALSGNQPFRTCFRIMPPEEDEKLWNLDYMLQARDDQSLIVPAEDIWKNAGGVSTFLEKKFDRPQERLLEDLGIASKAYAPILKSLYSAKPAGCSLSKEEAYIFLKEGALLLEESGFGIIAPSWWKKPVQLSMRLKVSSSGKSQAAVSKGMMSLDTLLEYDWRIAIGDSELNEEGFKKLAKLKIPLIKIRGEWVQLDPGQIDKLEELWKNKHKDNTASLGDILRMGLGQEELVNGIPIGKVDGNEEFTNFIKVLSDNSCLKELPSPDGLHGKLRPYQERGFSWLAFLRTKGIGACLADDMGLGKTVQMISLLLFERQEKMTERPTLLVCPTSVVGNWEKELSKFAPDLRVMIHHGQGRKSGSEFIEDAICHDVVISTYSLIYRDEAEFMGVDWAGVVLDEAQNIKNQGSKQTQSVKRIKAGYRVTLTGTPVENRLSELWSIMDFINPGYLGSNSHFRTEYAIPIEKYRDIEKGKKLKSIIAPFVLRRLKTDSNIINDLPNKIETKVYCSLTKEQATLYEAVVQDMLEKIEESEGIERKGMVLAAISKIKQICNHPLQFLKDGSTLDSRSGKLERLFEILEEILSGDDKVLIFTQFAEMGEILKKAMLKHLKADSLFLHGGVSRKSREEMVDAFQNAEKSHRIFILSLKAGGVGLNLTRASHVIHFDRWWNPAVENQATDRAFRIGQKKNVQVHKFICSGTIEEKIDAMLEDKKELAENIVGSGEEWLTEMSTRQLGEILKLNYNNVMVEGED